MRLTFRQTHLYRFVNMAKNRNYDRNPSRGCNFDLEGGAFLILGGAMRLSLCELQEQSCHKEFSFTSCKKRSAALLNTA